MHFHVIHFEISLRGSNDDDITEVEGAKIYLTTPLQNHI
jgi:hypothetical protein